MKKTLLSLITIISFYSVEAQLKIQTSPQTTIVNENPFLDASSFVKFPNSQGKGLYFPSTNLTEWTFKTDRISNKNFSTAFDGMVVYNTGKGPLGTSTVPYDVNTMGEQVEVEPGFYYFYNPDGATNKNVSKGKWIKLADVNPDTNMKFWTLNGNGSTIPVATTDFVAPINDDPALRDYSFNPEGKNFIGTTDNKNVTFATGEANDAGGFKTVARLAIGDIKNRTENKSKFKFVMEVYGKAHFEDGIVTTASTYPDYVFDNYFTGKSDVNPDYKFKKLNEVEAFIKENNHLPGVTKIDDLAKTESGYEVDNTQLSIQTLEKVEELYLHLIEQQKEIQALKAQIAELKK